MKMIVKILAFSFAAATAFATAQAADTTGCTPQERQQANQNLSQKLDDNAGVICPPDVDPAMKAPTPKGGNTPVIPPPGSPGGDPNVQPK
jgi:hypothetical protein